jgi:hypothetical protein
MMMTPCNPVDLRLPFSIVFFPHSFWLGDYLGIAFCSGTMSL